ncbi:hypothetical protein AAVH_38624, partial [Aphelenchoides avenae]
MYSPPQQSLPDGDKKYQCFCGIHIERAAYILALVGAVYSTLTLSILPLGAYVSLVLAVKYRSVSMYVLYFFIG